VKLRSAAIVGITICAGFSAPLLKKALRPLGVYALAGGMLVYEAVCTAGEIPVGAVMGAFSRVERRFGRILMKKSADEVAES
jgi:hypothetical protein